MSSADQCSHEAMYEISALSTAVPDMIVICVPVTSALFGGGGKTPNNITYHVMIKPVKPCRRITSTPFLLGSYRSIG